ncbi:MAG: hypothetical protein KAI03_06065 [Candidatus Aureabacteria bacterium]|nr:hypothetical protein [Candidatus Auribacterota bacterium]
MKSRLIVGIIIISLMLLSVPLVSNALDWTDIKIPRYPVALEGVIQDVEGNPVDNVTLHIWTEYPTKPFTEEVEERYYRRVVNGLFYIQLPASYNMRIAAEKEGYRGSSGYHFKAEELSAKDVVIRLLPYVRESRLKKGSGRVEITKTGESFMYSFKRGRKVSLKWKPDPYDIYVYLDVAGEPASFGDIGTYSVALVGVEVEFFEGTLLPPLKYAGQSYLGGLLQAPEDGYVSRIEIDNPRDLEKKCFYFKTREGKYGKLRIEYVDASDCLLVTFKYYFQSDGTRDLATKLSFVPPDMIPPETTDNYQYNGIWINQDANITLTATDDISGVANTYYTIDGVEYEGTSISITDEGEHVVNYWSVDNTGNVEAEKAITVKIDKTSPEVSISVDPSILWPVNQVVEVTINGSAADNLSGISSKEFTVVDEYEEVEASPSDFGDKIEVISWRKGSDIEGRTYTVSVVVIDKAGNSTTKETTAIVPHDMR